MADTMHHMHLRKRVHQNLEPYPHPDKWKNLLDNLVFAFAMFSALMTVPQLVQVWGSGSAAGVSPLSWGAYTVTSCFWVVYGMAHKEPTIITVNALFAFLNALVFIGVMLHP